MKSGSQEECKGFSIEIKMLTFYRIFLLIVSLVHIFYTNKKNLKQGQTWL